MTDVPATQRLLEVIEEQVANAERGLADRLPPATESALTEILATVIELRRRGDTIVRRDDLGLVLGARPGRPLRSHTEAEWEAAVARLENALGVKMR